MKIHLSTLALLVAVAGAAVSFAVEAQERSSLRPALPSLQAPAQTRAPKPVQPASAPSTSSTSREPIALCACVRPRPQA